MKAKNIIICGILLTAICLSVAVGAVRFRRGQLIAKIETVNVGRLHEEGHQLILKRAALLVKTRGQEPDRMRYLSAVVLMQGSQLFDEECPFEIKQLNPRFVDVYEDHIFIYLSSIPRLGISVFLNDNIQLPDARALGTGVWLEAGWR